MTWFLVLLLSLVASVAEATTWPAADCSRTEVSSKLAVAANGDTVTIPAGTCTWSSAIVLTSKSIIIQGVGGATTGTREQCDVGGQTTYTCVRGTTPLFRWTTTATEVGGVHPRLTGITWLTDTGTSGCESYRTGMLSILGTSGSLRIDHGRFDAIGCNGIVFDGLTGPNAYVRGVIDHNDFILRTSQAHSLSVTHASWLNAGKYGDQSWASDSTVGSAEALYVEHNTFCVTTSCVTNLSNTQAFTDDTLGARVVYRFNTSTDATFATHGTESGGRLRGFRHAEYYNNTYIYTGVLTPDFVGYRGGTGFIFDNPVSGNVQNIVSLTTFRRDDLWSTHNGSYPFGRCGELSVTSLTRLGSIATVVTPSTSSGHYTNDGGSYIAVTGADQSAYNVTTASRRNTGMSISSSSAANPTTITTSSAHGWSSGQRVAITGHSFSAVNGTWTITVTGTTTFTIPVSVTSGGSGGTASNTGATFFTYTVAGTPATPATGVSLKIVSPFDGNQDSTGYPCLDQAGRGKGTLLSGDGPGGSTISPVASLNQASEPIYTWNNLVNSVLSPTWAQSGGSVIIENREFYNQCGTAQACTTFNGTVGIGRGVRASRPATCTTGVAYASTNGGTWNNGASSVVLDKCIATNTWQDGWYTPLAYPHFLTVAALPPPSPPPVPPPPPSVNLNIGGSHQIMPPPGVRFRDGVRDR